MNKGARLVLGPSPSRSRPAALHARPAENPAGEPRDPREERRDGRRTPIVAPQDASLDAAEPSASADSPASSDDVLDVPRTRSARPSARDWARAEEATFSTDCTLTLVREWARVRCGTIDDEAGESGGLYGSIVLLAGTRGDLSATIESCRSGRRMPEPRTRATLVMALRPGDRRVVQLYTLSMEASQYQNTPSAQVPGLTLSETWLAGARGPTIVVD